MESNTNLIMKYALRFNSGSMKALESHMVVCEGRNERNVRKDIQALINAGILISNKDEWTVNHFSPMYNRVVSRARYDL